MAQIRVTVIATGFDGKRRQQTMEFAATEQAEDSDESLLMPAFEQINDEDLDIPAFLKKRTF